MQYLKKAIKASLYYSGLISLVHLASSRATLRVPILQYHRVNSGEDDYFDLAVAPEYFEKQMKCLTRHYNVISLAELIDRLRQGTPIPKRPAVVTFDDGYRDNYLVAYPILKKYKVPATIFLTVGYIDAGRVLWVDRLAYMFKTTPLETLEIELPELGSGSHIYRLKGIQERLKVVDTFTSLLKTVTEDRKNDILAELAGSLRVNMDKVSGSLMLTWKQVKEMDANGISFQSHTMTHPILTKVSNEQARSEIVESKRTIQEKTGKPVICLAYPNGGPGDFDDSIVKILADSGYQCAISSLEGLVGVNSDLYALRRKYPVFNRSSHEFVVNLMEFSSLFKRY